MKYLDAADTIITAGKHIYTISITIIISALSWLAHNYSVAALAVIVAHPH
jgi:hypothetical protein